MQWDGNWYTTDASKAQILTMVNPPCTTAERPTDIDNNTYEVVGVAGNCWIQSNVRAEHYSVAQGTFAQNDSIEGKMIYNAEQNNDTVANLEKYSYLYTWYSAMALPEDDDATPAPVNEWGNTVGICPAGWILPNAADFRALVGINAQNLRSSDNWMINPGTGDNSLALEPGGCYSDGANRFRDLLSTAYFWSCEPVSAGSPIVRCWMADCFCYMLQEVTFPKSSALSVRCVKEQIKKAPEFQNLDLFAVAPSTSIWAIASFASLGCEISNYEYCIAEDNGMTTNKVCYNSQNPYYEFKNLTRGMTYYVQVTATNEKGTDVSSVESIMVPPIKPTVLTVGVTDKTYHSAMVDCNVSYDGGATVTERGVYYSTTTDPANTGTKKIASGTGEGTYSYTLEGLTPSTDYYVCAYAKNSVGVSYGEVKLFTTLAADTITFMHNGGLGTMNKQVFSRGIAEDLTTNAFNHAAVDPNWSFLGWNTEPDGSGDSYADESNYTSVANDTLYAQWKTWCTGVFRVANEVGTAIGTIDSLKDADGNSYALVQIGNQCWMKQNLRTTQYANGHIIGEGTVGETSTTVGFRYANTDDDANFVAKYGYLYNFAAVDSAAGLCPTGWHVPDTAEWNTLKSYVKGQNEYKTAVCTEADNENYTNCIAKSLASTTYWYKDVFRDNTPGSNPLENNATGFSVVPAGIYDYDGYFMFFAFYANFWSSTPTSDRAYSQNITYGENSVSRFDENKGKGFSVRCVRTESVTISFNANGGSGSMSDQVIEGSGILFANTFSKTDTAFVGWNTAADGTGNYYYDRQTITPLGDMTLYAQWCGTGKVKDVEENEYATLQINTQCWFKENLKTTLYANGNEILTGSTSTTTGYRYDNPNVTDFVAKCGYLYNWAAVTNENGLCPSGWRVPTDGEWDVLEHYVVGQDEFVSPGCQRTYDDWYTECVAKALASTTEDWAASSMDFSPGNVPSANNATGFSIVPAGSTNNLISSFGDYAYFWTSSRMGLDKAAARYVYGNSNYVQRDPAYRYSGYSVRCIRYEERAPEGAINAEFSVSPTSKVYFSKGNLQYIGSAVTPYWQFADNQTDIFGVAQNTSSGTLNRDLFGWACSGYHYSIWKTDVDENSYITDSLSITGTEHDWGTSNYIQNGGNLEGLWRCLNDVEWDYLFNTRVVNGGTGNGHSYVICTIGADNGMLIFHDNYVGPTSGFASIPEDCVFLPMAGRRDGTTVEGNGTVGYYWYPNTWKLDGPVGGIYSSSCFSFNSSGNFNPYEKSGRHYGMAVRVVMDKN